MAESFLSSLLSKASSLSEQKLLKGTSLQTKARVYKASDKPLSEPKYIPKKTNTIDSLLQQAKDYGVNQPQQVNQAAGYLTSLYSGNLNIVQQSKDNIFNSAMANYNKSLANYNKSLAESTNTIQNSLSGGNNSFKLVEPIANDDFFKTLNKNKNVSKEDRIKYNKNTAYTDILSTQATQLQALNSTQESLFGVNFSNVDAQTLQAANWSGVKALQAEVEKYTALRDVYAEKYSDKPNETNLNYIKSYSNLVYDTAKNMTDETTRTLMAAKNNAAIQDKIKTSTISALEKYNEVLGGTADKDIKQPTDVNTNVNAMKQQILARANAVSGYLEKVKSSPKFEERPL